MSLPSATVNEEQDDQHPEGEIGVTKEEEELTNDRSDESSRVPSEIRRRDARRSVDVAVDRTSRRKTGREVGDEGS